VNIISRGSIFNLKIETKFALDAFQIAKKTLKTCFGRKPIPKRLDAAKLNPPIDAPLLNRL
jgi:hypothetical protein